jgi:hypothetical protein
MISFNGIMKYCWRGVADLEGEGGAGGINTGVPVLDCHGDVGALC